MLGEICGSCLLFLLACQLHVDQHVTWLRVYEFNSYRMVLLVEEKGRGLGLGWERLRGSRSKTLAYLIPSWHITKSSFCYLACLCRRMF